MIRFLLAAIMLLFTFQQSTAQIFPDLEGNELMTALVDSYKTSTILSSSGSKDSLYAVVENFNGQVECVYTGYSITLSPGEDPSQDAFAKNINQEHVFPRSQGVDNTQAEYDMHHLYPSRVDVNQDRGSLIFGESQDNLTNRWYINSSTSSSTPSSNIDGYSEWRSNTVFEPRENRKGDIARAVFYVYTMYNNLIDQEFFEEQKATLCDWHHADPVDEREFQRSNRVAYYQEGKPNPFVLDCTLAERLFCESNSEPCDNTAVSIQNIEKTSPAVSIKIVNNGQSNPALDIESKEDLEFLINITDILGNRVIALKANNQLKQKYYPAIDFGLRKGIYFVSIQAINQKDIISKKLIIQ